jgi:glycosyltransferase involved in cell wall biosynthesis
MPVRVALLVTDLETGGTPLRIAAIARTLKSQGQDVVVGCLAPPGTVSETLAADGIATFACGARSARDLGVFAKLASHLRTNRPDLVHATLLHANVAARFVGRALGLPVLTSTATIEVERRWHAPLERLTSPLDQGHIVHGHALAEHVRRAFGVPARKIHVLPPMLHRSVESPDEAARTAARAALGIRPAEFVVAWTGRMDPVKRLELVVECAERLAELPSRFLIAGDGPERDRLLSHLRRSRAPHAVQFLGWQEDVDPVLAAADAFLFPSRTEGMPNAVLEALAAGLPVVASDLPALRELAGDADGLVLVPGAAVEAFAAALRNLQSDPQRRRALGDRAAAWARETLSAERAVQQLQQIYRDVTGRG